MTLFYRLFVIISSIITIILDMVTTQHIPNNLVLLPFVFVLLFVVFPSFSRYIFNNLGITIINFTMLLRYVVSPFLMALYGSDIQMGSTVSIDIQNKAVLLMVYEMIAMFLIFALLHKYFYSNNSKIRNVKSQSNIFGWIFIAFALLIIINQPSVLGNYSFIWSASKLKTDTANENVTLFAFLIQLAQIVFTVSILNIIHKYYEKKNSIIYLFLSFIVIVASASFITGTSRSSIIIPLVTGLFALLVLYNKYRKLIIGSSLILSLLVISVSTLLKQQTNVTIGSRSLYHSAGPLENFNTDIQLYFSGLINVGHSIETSSVIRPFDFNLIMSDLTHSVVFINNFFHQSQSALIAFNDMFYKTTGVADQIVPILGQGYLYFGTILAPIFSVIGLIVVMFLDKMVFRTKSVFTLYILSYFCLKFSMLFMSNATILTSFFTNFILILLLIAYLNSKISYKKE